MFDFSGFGGDGGDSIDTSSGDSLTSQILQSVTALGAVGIQAATQPNINTSAIPQGYAVGQGGVLVPAARPTVSNGMGLLIFGAIAVGAYLLLRH